MVSDMSAIVTQTPVACDNMGQIGVAISGGEPSYRIDFTGPRTGTLVATNTGANSGTGTILDLPAGYYTIVVTDSRGCSATETITVTGMVSDMSAIVTQRPVACGTMGQLAVAILGGEPSYRIDFTGPRTGTLVATNTGSRSGTGTITDLPAGDYTIVVTDSRGCSDTERITVTGMISDLSAALTLTQGRCDEPSQVGVAISGGTPTYRIDYTGPVSGAVIATNTGANSGTGTITDLPAGDYVVVVTDSRGCSVTERIWVGILSSDISTVLTLRQGICNELSQIGIAISGGVPTYRIDYTGPVSGAVIATTTDEDTGTGTLLNLPNGEYTIVVTDSRGCSDTRTATVSDASSDLACVLMQTPQVCNTNGTITVAISGGSPAYRVDYTGPSSGAIIATLTGERTATADITNLVAGLYTITVTDSNGCTASESIRVGGGASDLVATIVAQPEICTNTAGLDIGVVGGTAPYTIAYSGPVSASFISSNGATQFVPLPLGDYVIVITDANGCSITENAWVKTGVDDLQVQLVATSEICLKNGTIEIIISGGQPGFTIEWSNGQSKEIIIIDGASYIMEVPSLGVYDIIVIDANGCQVSQSIEVRRIENNLTYEVIPFSGTEEGEGRLEIYFQQGQPLYTIELTGPVVLTKVAAEAIVLDNLPSGDYSVYIIDANGCSKQMFVTILKAGEVPPPAGPNLDGMMSVDNNAESTNLTVTKTATTGSEGVEESELERLPAIPLEVNNEVIKNEFMVYQNYPNPFKLSTTISFYLPRDMNVKMIIHDNSGKTVSVVEQDFVKGLNEYEFNAQNLTKGVYYYTISAGKDTKTSRMLRVE